MDLIKQFKNKIMSKHKHELTNRDIADEYSNSYFHLMLGDFTGELAKWIVRQDNSKSWQLQIDAIEAYEDYLKEIKFKTKDTVCKMNTADIRELVNEKIFCAIPEIYALNQVGKGFVDLGALARNVSYGILREQICQPL